MERRRRQHQPGHQPGHHQQWSGAVGQDMQDVATDQLAPPAKPPVIPATPRATLPSLRELRPPPPARSPERRVRQAKPPAPHPSVAAAQSSPRRTPGAPRSRRRWLFPSLVTLALLVALIAGALWLLYAPQWQVQRVRIAGTRDPVVISAIQRMSFANCDIFRCDMAAMARRVEALPLVAQATVAPSYPNTLVVSVRLRQPALLWQGGAGDTFVVASDGVALGSPARDPTFAAASLTSVIETGSASQIVRELRNTGRMDPTLATMAPQVREVNREVFNGAAVLNYADGTGFTLTAPSGLQVILGAPADAVATWNDVTAPPATASDAGGGASTDHPQASASSPGAIKRAVALQLAELRGILAYLAQQGQQATVIDLRWGAHPYYRLAGA